MRFNVTFQESTQRITPEFNITGQTVPVEFGNFQTVTSAPDVDLYTGEYEVTPKADDVQTLRTAQKYLSQDVHVHKIPYYEIDNAAGGITVYIGTEDELIIE